MRILVLTNQYPPHSIGGYALSCQSIVERLMLRGHEVYVLTSDVSVPGAADAPDEATGGIHRDLYAWFRGLGRQEPKVPNPPLRDRLRYERRNQRIMLKVLREWRPDVVSVWDMGAMSLSTLTLVEQAEIPTVVTLHDYWPQYAPLWDPWLRAFDRWPWARGLAAPTGMVTRAPGLSTALVNVISQDLREKLARDSRWDFSGAKVIPFGIDAALFPVLPPVGGEWRWRILYVGRLDWSKGLRTLALGMRDLPAEASLEVLGSGDPEIPARMRKIIGGSEADERVRFSNFPRTELARRYRAADVVVFPSEWDEPFGLVPLEAMACGVPVVATGTGGSAEYLRDGHNCLLFPPGDSPGLALAVKRLADDLELRNKILEGGGRTARDHSLERCVDELETLHFTAAGLRQGPRP
jgi:glycosyltransferase involved in cell wall biosynthesis